MNIELLHFLRPYWLPAIIPFLIAVILVSRRHARRSNWRSVVAPELLPLLLRSNQQARTSWPVFITSIAGILSVIALAGPTWERIPQPVFRNDDALVIILDLSRSMDAQDIKPSRLQRARYKIIDILKSRPEGQAALIVYAADAFTVTPLTDDDDTIISQLPALTTNLMPAQGARTDRALALASQLLKQASQPEGRILLITDEIEAGPGAADRPIADGYELSILGMGTQDGAPIPIPGGVLKDKQGNIVIARLNGNNLRRIAHAGKGQYATVTSNDNDIRQLGLDKRFSVNDAPEKNDDLTSDIWKEAGPWLLLPVLPLAALAFRRGILGLGIILLLPVSPPADALEPANFWRNLWQTPDQQAQKLFNNGEITEAANRFEQPLWKGSAHYSAANYDKALEIFQSAKGAAARYNEGNTLARLGRYADAIKSYEQAIRQSPGHSDAIHNKKLIAQLLEQRKQQSSAPTQQQHEPQPSENSQEQQDPSGTPANKQAQAAQDKRNKEPSAHQKGTESERPSQKAAAEDQQAEQQDRQQTPPRPSDAQQQQPGQEAADDPKPAPPAGPDREQILAREQWLNRIPDDPAGLLKRKFQYQYRQKARTDDGGKPW